MIEDYILLFKMIPDTLKEYGFFAPIVIFISIIVLPFFYLYDLAKGKV